jgi:hypothetical protein
MKQCARFSNNEVFNYIQININTIDEIKAIKEVKIVSKVINDNCSNRWAITAEGIESLKHPYWNCTASLEECKIKKMPYTYIANEEDYLVFTDFCIEVYSEKDFFIRFKELYGVYAEECFHYISSKEYTLTKDLNSLIEFLSGTSIPFSLTNEYVVILKDRRENNQIREGMFIVKKIDELNNITISLYTKEEFFKLYPKYLEETNFDTKREK